MPHGNTVDSMDTDELPVFWNDDCLDYRMPDGAYYLASHELVAVDEPHPDRPERLTNIRHILTEVLGDELSWRIADTATADELCSVHAPTYIRDLTTEYRDSPGRVTVDTRVNEAMLRAARAAAGCALEAAHKAVASQTATYSLARPSGHHAQPTTADGFCLFNNIAIAAQTVLETTDIDRIAIIDWDVHHGNGTQEIFYDRDDVLVLNLHNYHGAWNDETHPQTGKLTEHGSGGGRGFNVNVPLPLGTGNNGYRLAFTEIVEPVVAAFDPDLILVSAGQDAGVLDPQGRNIVTKPGFKSMGRAVGALADDLAGGRLTIVQEGGYQLSHLPFATLGVIEGVLDIETDVTDPFSMWPEDDERIARAVSAAKSVHEAHWPTLSE